MTFYEYLIIYGCRIQECNCLRTFCIVGIHVRLTDGNRLEVSEDGHTWGTVCNDGFGVNEAKVACRMLGYPTYDTVFSEQVVLIS